MRGSELVALTLADIEAKPRGILVSIRHSKAENTASRSLPSRTAATPTLTRSPP